MRKWTLVLSGVSVTEMCRALQGTDREDNWIDYAKKIEGTQLYEVKLPMPDMERLSKAISVIRTDVCPSFKFYLECDTGVRIHIATQRFRGQINATENKR